MDLSSIVQILYLIINNPIWSIMNTVFRIEQLNTTKLKLNHIRMAILISSVSAGALVHECNIHESSMNIALMNIAFGAFGIGICPLNDMQAFDLPSQN